MEPDWVQHAVWWRVYPLGFVGAFPEPPDGPAVAHEHRLRRLTGWLEHVVELGASGLALGPVFASSGHGYDTLDHRHIDPRLGTEQDFDDLVGEAHRLGLRVQLDGVFNHVSRDHPRAVAAAADGFEGDDARWFRLRESGDGSTGFVGFEGHDALVELDHGCPAVVDEVVDVMRHWLDRGADAWRLDAAYRVATSFWAQVLPEVRRTHPEVWFEAEVIHGDYARFVADSTADTVTQYELWKAVWSSIDDGNLFELDHTLLRHNELLATFAPATFVGNHDVTRIASRIDDRRHLPHAVALLCLLGGTPTVYAGDELGLTGTKVDRAGGDDAVRPEFPESPAGLPGGLAGVDPEVLSLHQQVIGLRRRHPWLHRATSRAVQLENRLYRLVVEAEPADPTCARALTLHLSLDDESTDLPDTELLAADPGSAPGRLAGHGWAVTAGAHARH